MNYLYIDAACIQAELKQFGALLNEETVPFSYERFISYIGADRIFVYDAWPARKDSESENEFESRREEKRQFMARLSKIPLVHVRDGVTRWRKRRGQEQKAVDVLLAVDVVSHALRDMINRATLVLSDLDFYPIFDALLQSRVRTHLIFRPGHTSDELVEAADTAAWLTKTQILNSCDEDFAARFRPKYENRSEPLTSLEKSQAAFAQFRGHELAVWCRSNGQYACFYNGNRVHSTVKELAIEHFVQGTIERLDFSDGTAFP